VSAADIGALSHSTDVTLSPDVASCGDILQEFEVNIESSAAEDFGIYNVKIYKAETNIEELVCGDEPDGFTFLGFKYESYCEYETDPYGNDTIKNGEDVTFTFEAVLNQEDCESIFIITTLDNEGIIGDGDGIEIETEKTLIVDCEDPVIYKEVGFPKIESNSDDFLWWITQNTQFDVLVTDNDTCDLGLDSCLITYILDNGSIVNEIEDASGLGGTEAWSYDFSYDDDSKHFLEITCEDVAGNIAKHNQTEKVDTTPPETTKWFDGPQKIISNLTGSGKIEWIDGVTEVVLNVEDGGDICAIGVDETYYVNILAEDFVEDNDLDCDPETPCWDPGYCQSLLQYDDMLLRMNIWDTYEGPFPKGEESCHVLFYYSIDDLGNKEDMQVNCFFVDKTPPIGIKEVDTPRVPIVVNEFQEIGSGTASWTDSDSKFGSHSARLYVPDGTTDMAAVEFDVDIALEDIMELSFWQKIDNIYGVNIILGIDADGDGTYESLDKPWHLSHDSADLGDDTFLEMDGMPGSSGSWEEVDAMSLSQWWTPNDAGDGFCATMGWNPLSDAQSSSKCRVDPTDRVKVIRLLIGGSGTWMDKIALVDDIMLNDGIIALQPKNWYVTSGSEITLTCEDQEPHPSGDEEVCFKIGFDESPFDLTSDYCNGYMEDGYCCEDSPRSLFFLEESEHTLDYFCRDAVNKTSEIDSEIFKVDNTEPYLIEKIITGPSIALEGECPPRPDSNDVCHIDGVTTIDVEVEDGGQVCAVGVDECRWRYRVYTEVWGPYTDWNYTFPISFPEESKHELEIGCYDELGNTMTDTEIFYVDKTAPETTFSVTGPQVPNPITETSKYPRWVDTDSRIKLEATDANGPHDSGVDETYYRITQVIDRYCESAASGCSNAQGTGDFIPYDGEFAVPESCHLIEYYSVDNVNKVEDAEKQCVFSDHTAPSVSVNVGEPKLSCADCDYWITQDTEVKLNCVQEGPHPSPLDTLSWRIKVDDGLWGEWLTTAAGVEGYDKTITFGEDSRHYIEYKCNDSVGKESQVYSKNYRVDSTAPEITITESDPKYYNASEDKLYLNHVTEVSISAVDPDPTGFDCNVSGVTCEWGYYLDDGSYYELDTTNPFIFPEETRHELVVRCNDSLGNVNETRKTYYVDWTRPGISKRYEEGRPLVYDVDGGSAKWIDSNTSIFGGVTDNGTHKSGIQEVKYRTFVVDDADCIHPIEVQYVDTYNCSMVDLNDTTWTTVDPAYYNEFEFKIPEDSCHLIEIMATDNVDKCALHKQWVYVDNQAPTPNKTVGEISTEWYPVDVAVDPFNPDATHFYPWIVDRCWNDQHINGSIDCWKVTLDTEISMECVDPTPHPVGDEKVCFNVEMDGEDITDGDGCPTRRCGRPEGYCNEYGGEMNDEGYCCVSKTAVDEFTFLEESEHNLKYYCEDALENRGPVDDEKFKVSGKMFKIKLNDKWNLISVPFVLQEDDPKEVFKDAESVKTVWSYNGLTGKWSVYRPDNENISDLDAIEPGLGYWILSDCETPIELNAEDYRWKCDADKCEMLVVGGSLYSPGPVAPPSQDLPEGWSLIGLYGTEGKHGYYGPNSWFNWFGYGRDAYCELYSLRNLNEEGSTKWSALVGYWEPENPGAWYNLEKCDEMDPGAGYWISMDAEGNYRPSTICDDEHCEDDGGWWFW
jgi:hypothetical protein